MKEGFIDKWNVGIVLLSWLPVTFTAVHVFTVLREGEGDKGIIETGYYLSLCWSDCCGEKARTREDHSQRNKEGNC